MILMASLVLADLGVDVRSLVLGSVVGGLIGLPDAARVAR